MDRAPALERSLSLPVFVAYGVGTMVGAGYYALLGEVAGVAGMAAPLAFALAGVVAGLSAMSFGALGARFPSSAGPGTYVAEGIDPRLGGLVGWLVVATGVVSAAALARAFARFLVDLAPVPEVFAAPALVVLLAAVAAWGIRASAGLAVVITVLELGGLAWVALVNAGAAADLPSRAAEMASDAGVGLGAGLFAASFLSFYAFVGFEDMVTLAEELREPRRNLPRGVLLALGITTALYVVVTTLAVLAVPPAELAESRTPLARLVGEPGGAAAVTLTLVSLLTGVNGALVQIVMASRVAYGLASRGAAPAWLGRVHPGRRTPVVATVLAAAVVIALAATLDLVALARVTAGVILVVFGLVNVALVRVRSAEIARGVEPEGVPCPPRWAGVLGALTCAALLVMSLL